MDFYNDGSLRCIAPDTPCTSTQHQPRLGVQHRLLQPPWVSVSTRSCLFAKLSVIFSGKSPSYPYAAPSSASCACLPQSRRCSWQRRPRDRFEIYKRLLADFCPSPALFKPNTDPFGKPSKKSLCGPSEKLATLNQLVALFPFSSFGPVLTPSEYLTSSRPVDVGVSSGWSARRPMSCIFARGRAGVVENARAARGSWKRRACMVLLVRMAW